MIIKGMNAMLALLKFLVLLVSVPLRPYTTIRRDDRRRVA
jgi:hypothetical protein